MNLCSGGVCASKGFTASGVHCGIRKNKQKLDLAVIKSEVMCNAAAVYTKNKVKGAPLIVTKQHLINGKAQAIICNSGNANTCTPNGVDTAEKICNMLSKEIGIKKEDVLVNSTGVIGQELDIEPFTTGIPNAVLKLNQNGSEDAAVAIMTTDLKIKEVAYKFEINNKTCHIGAIGKGSGMIHPNMATMLIFITTDVNISHEMLQKALSSDVDDTFNQISVDGDTSTNDTVIVMANGLAENDEINSDSEQFKIFAQALKKVTTHMSKSIAADGEGAGKLLECTVVNANTIQNARAISKSIICSSLFKAAMFGEDANWGRALCAIGYTPGDFNIDGIEIILKSKNGSVKVCKNAMHVQFSEDEAKKVLMADEIEILVDMNDGNKMAQAWGCDLTYDYIKINGDYRT